MQKVVEVSYKLELPADSKLHIVFTAQFSEFLA